MRHDTKMVLAALALSLVGLGCSSSHETIAATSGVYELTISGEIDACSPLRATGPMGTASVVQQGTLLTVSAPDLVTSYPMLVSLNGQQGFSDERATMLDTCTDATLTRTYSVVGHDANGLDVAYTETWSGLETCGAAMRSIMPAAPTHDCRADLVLHYRFESACAAPCQLRLAADGGAACQC